MVGSAESPASRIAATMSRADRLCVVAGLVTGGAADELGLPVLRSHPQIVVATDHANSNTRKRMPGCYRLGIESRNLIGSRDGEGTGTPLNLT